MDIAVINQFISTVGFPIAVSIALFWYVQKQDKQHSVEMDNIRLSLDNNTKVLTKLYERLGGEE